MITAAILVGGRARRFDGQLKSALRIGDQTIIERQLEEVRKMAVQEVLLVGRWPAAAVVGVRHVPDVLEESSALGGLYTALLISTSPSVLVLAGDLPFVHAALLRRLTELGLDDEAVVPRTSGRWHPLCAVYRRRVALRIKARVDRGTFRVSDALSDMRVRELTSDELAAMDPDGMTLMNVNTPDDHRRAERRARLRS